MCILTVVYLSWTRPFQRNSPPLFCMCVFNVPACRTMIPCRRTESPFWTNSITKCNNQAKAKPMHKSKTQERKGERDVDSNPHSTKRISPHAGPSMISPYPHQFSSRGGAGQMARDPRHPSRFRLTNLLWFGRLQISRVAQVQNVRYSVPGYVKYQQDGMKLVLPRKTQQTLGAL